MTALDTLRLAAAFPHRTVTEWEAMNIAARSTGLSTVNLVASEVALAVYDQGARVLGIALFEGHAVFGLRVLVEQPCVLERVHHAVNAAADRARSRLVMFAGAELVVAPARRYP